MTERPLSYRLTSDITLAVFCLLTILFLAGCTTEQRTDIAFGKGYVRQKTAYRDSAKVGWSRKLVESKLGKPQNISHKENDYLNPHAYYPIPPFPNNAVIALEYMGGKYCSPVFCKLYVFLDANGRVVRTVFART